MNILIAGSSGLIGQAVTKYLRFKGHIVIPLTRSLNSSNASRWMPSEGRIHFDRDLTIDAVINLSGANISDGRWTERRKNLILSSRVHSTALLAQALAEREQKPQVFISSSAIGFYGESGSISVDESAPQGSDFLSQVSVAWEAAAKPASAAGIRTVNMRTGVVISADGGALKQMLFPFKCGLGGVVGKGQQYMSWVSIRDMVSMMLFAIENDALTGPVNFVSPNPVTNKEFTQTLSSALKRPALLPMPAALARVVFGEMADALLLTSIRVQPTKLMESAYPFKYSILQDCLRSEINY
jgi:uncharacterized protein (TIGR01777 family)